MGMGMGLRMEMRMGMRMGRRRRRERRMKLVGMVVKRKGEWKEFQRNQLLKLQLVRELS